MILPELFKLGNILDLNIERKKGNKKFGDERIQLDCTFEILRDYFKISISGQASVSDFNFRYWYPMTDRAHSYNSTIHMMDISINPNISRMSPTELRSRHQWFFPYKKMQSKYQIVDQIVQILIPSNEYSKYLDLICEAQMEFL